MNNLGKKFDILEIAFDRYYSIFEGKFVNKQKNLELAIKVLLLVVALLLAGFCITVSYAIKASNNKTIEVTMNKNTLKEGSTYTISRDKASKNYFESIAYGNIHEITNYDFNTIQDKANFLLSFVHPNNYDEIYDSLNEEVNFIAKNRVSQKFEIKDWVYKELSSSVVEIKAIGYLTRKVGGILTINNKKYTTSITLMIKSGIIFVNGLKWNYRDNQVLTNKREKRVEKIKNFDKESNYKGMNNDKK